MKNIVFIVSFELDQRARDQGYQWSIRSWKNWCEKNDAELVVLDEPLFDLNVMKATWQRYYLFDILEANNIDYDQVLMVDSDTIIHPECPNILDLTDHKYCAVRDFGSMDWFCRSIEVYSKFMFTGETINYWEYLNGGFQVVNKNHKEFYEHMVKFYHNNKENILKLQDTFYLGTDQTPLNFLLRGDNIDINILPYEFNMTDMGRVEILGQDMLFTKFGWVYHFNCWPKPTPGWWMEKTYRYLYETNK